MFCQKQGALIETLFCQSYKYTICRVVNWCQTTKVRNLYGLCSFTSCSFEWMCFHVCILGKIAALLHKHWCLFWNHNAGTLCERCDVKYKVWTSNSALPCLSTRWYCIKTFIDEPSLADELWFGERDLLWQVLYWLTPEPFTAFFIVPCKKIIAEILKYLQQSNYWNNIWRDNIWACLFFGTDGHALLILMSNVGFCGRIVNYVTWQSSTSI